MTQTTVAIVQHPSAQLVSTDDVPAERIDAYLAAPRRSWSRGRALFAHHRGERLDEAVRRIRRVDQVQALGGLAR
jgi:hypothetical protein